MSDQALTTTDSTAETFDGSVRLQFAPMADVSAILRRSFDRGAEDALSKFDQSLAQSIGRMDDYLERIREAIAAGLSTTVDAQMAAFRQSLSAAFAASNLAKHRIEEPSWGIRPAAAPDRTEPSSTDERLALAELFEMSVNERFDDEAPSIFSSRLVEFLDRNGPAFLDSLPDLFEFYAHRHLPLVIEAIRAVGAADNPETSEHRLAFLDSMLSSNLSQVRHAAALALADTGEPRASDWLQAAAKREANPYVRETMESMAKLSAA